jgi:hypothetical protein
MIDPPAPDFSLAGRTVRSVLSLTLRLAC